MALACISGIIGCIGGALKIAKAFSTQSMTSIQQTGSGSGFWRYYSNSAVGSLSMSVTKCDVYIQSMINRITKETTPEIQAKKAEIIEFLSDIKEFESYAWGDCDRMVNTVDYNKATGTLFVYIFTFSPFIHPRKGEGVRVQTLRICCNMELAKDWMVVSKVKASFFKTTATSEIQYIPNKSIKMSDVIEAISIAMAPAVLGLVQLPERFMTMLDSILKDQQANPQKGIVTAETSEQVAQKYQAFKEMQAKQDEYIQNAQTGFSDLSEAISALGGNKTEETPAITN